MLFHIEPWVFLSFFAAKIQLISTVLGPLLCTCSLVCSALCLISSFQGSPLGARPLVRSLAKSASDWTLGSIIPSPPLEVGIAIVSHFTLACAGASRPPHMKFLTMPLIWEHILGLGFQDAAMYHMEANRTWFATRILPARENRLLLQLMSLFFKDSLIFPKFASGGRWEPTCTPRYLVPSPSGIHLSPTFSP